MAKETIQEFKDELKEIKNLSIETLKLLRSEREERLKNTNDILRLDRQININNGDKCIKTRLTEAEDRIDNHDKQLSNFKAVCVFVGGLFTAAAGILGMAKK
jgi:hypothetical protein